MIDYLRADFRRAAQRAFISCESLFRPAAVRPPFFAEGAGFVPPAFLLAAQRAFISSESLFRPAGVRAPLVLLDAGVLAAAGFVPPFSLAQRALAASESLARVEGEKYRPACARVLAVALFLFMSLFVALSLSAAGAPRRIEERRLSRLSICRRIETASSKA